MQINIAEYLEQVREGKLRQRKSVAFPNHFSFFVLNDYFCNGYLLIVGRKLINF